MLPSRLVTPSVIVLSIALAACSSSPGGGASGGTGGQTGSGGPFNRGSGGDGGSRDSGGGGAAADAPVDLPVEVAPRDICVGFVPRQTQFSGVTGADFCASFATACGYGVRGGYTSNDDCLARYGAADDGARNCRLDSLCTEVLGTKVLASIPPSLVEAYCMGASNCDGSGGASGSGGSSGSGGTNGCGGATMDASVDSRDAGSDPLCGDHRYGCGPVPGVAAAVFCARYGAVCQFGEAGGYADMADCAAKYGAVSSAVKSCRAASLCDTIIAAERLGPTVARAFCSRAASNIETCM